MSALRRASDVMRLSRLGSAHQTRLSFMRVLLRGLKRGGWQVDRTHWQIDATGVGYAVYRASGQGQVYSLVAFAHDLPDEMRTDRVIAEAWDATFALMDGTPTPDDIERLRANVPLQEAGRISDKEVVLSRANRSSRLWWYVVNQLAQGVQPDPSRLEEVGYLMRTTAVYGSGKFGAADRALFSGRPLMDGPFRAEMLTVWLIRTFVSDLVEYMAKAQGGDRAIRLAPSLRRSLGIGNSTGLGMAPFLVNHPALLHAWLYARETALSRVRAQETASFEARHEFRKTLERSTQLLSGWTTSHPQQRDKLDALRNDLETLRNYLEGPSIFKTPKPWNALWLWGANKLSTEGQEMLLSMMLEPHGALVDDLADRMGADEGSPLKIDATGTVADLVQSILNQYSWALNADYDQADACARFWYVSEAKLEPRLGERAVEPGAALEQPLDVARAISRLETDLKQSPTDQPLADFLALHPEHRHIVRRVQLNAKAPYSEIQDNLIASDCMPIDMLRCKLAFFGATRFDPRSDRWVRITMYQGAPYPDDLHEQSEDDWVLPNLPIAAQ